MRFAVSGGGAARGLGSPSNMVWSRRREAAPASRKLPAVILLSLPAIVGTGFFLAGAILSRVDEVNSAPVDIWRQPTGLEGVTLFLAFALFLACYSGAAVGPLLLPVAAQQALRLTRAVGMRSTVAMWAWAFVAMGLVATLLFWGWLINLDIFI